MNKILLFFDPGVDTSGATYLFDNLVIEPSGACKGVARNAAIWDDFDCQRNVQVALPGLTDLTAVVNPDKSGINTSAKVGRYKDTDSEWHAMVLDYGENIPLDRLSLAKIKVWAPVAGMLCRISRNAKWLRLCSDGLQRNVPTIQCVCCR